EAVRLRVAPVLVRRRTATGEQEVDVDEKRENRNPAPRLLAGRRRGRTHCGPSRSLFELARLSCGQVFFKTTQQQCRWPARFAHALLPALDFRERHIEACGEIRSRMNRRGFPVFASEPMSVRMTSSRPSRTISISQPLVPPR